MMKLKDRPRHQEELLAKEHGGRRTPASGSKLSKGDVNYTKTGFTIEAKTTMKRSFSITRTIIEKAKKAALTHGENWLLQVDMVGDPTLRVAVLDYDVLMQLLREQKS